MDAIGTEALLSSVFQERRDREFMMGRRFIGGWL
jgi:hypothetical protein